MKITRGTFFSEFMAFAMTFTAIKRLNDMNWGRGHSLACKDTAVKFGLSLVGLILAAAINLDFNLDFLSLPF